MGHIITDEGIEVDDDKIKAIKEMPAPQNIKQLRSFLGMVNYSSKFIENLSSEASELRKLDRKG